MLIQVVLFVSLINLAFPTYELYHIRVNLACGERKADSVTLPYKYYAPRARRQKFPVVHPVYKNLLAFAHNSHITVMLIQMQSMNCVFLQKSLGKGPFRAVRTEKLGIELHCSNYKFTQGPAWILVSLVMFSNKETRPPR